MESHTKKRTRDFVIIEKHNPNPTSQELAMNLWIQLIWNNLKNVEMHKVCSKNNKKRKVL